MSLFPLSDLLSGGNKQLRTELVKTTVATETLQNAVSSTGDGTSFTVDGYGVAKLQITGTFTATVTFYGSVDGTNFSAIPARKESDGTTVYTTASTGIYEINCRGLQKIRAAVTWTSGTSITIVGRAEPFAGSNSSIQLTGRRLKIGVLRTAYSTEVVASTASIVIITPTTGYIGRLLAFGYQAPAVAGSTGNHQLYLQTGSYTGTAPSINSLQSISSAGTSALALAPATTTDGYKGAVFDATNPIIISYIAPGTVNQTGTRYVYLLWEEEAVSA